MPGVGRAAVRPPRLLNTGSLHAEYGVEQRAVWIYMCPGGRPCFSANLLGDILAQQHAVAEEPESVDFVVLASAVPNVFNLGGDLDLFRTQMHQIGLVDYLAEKGMGGRVTRNVISDKAWTLNGYCSFQMAKLHSFLAVPYRELLEIAREWARAACRLDARDLKMMERLARAQERLTGRPG